MVVGSVTWGTVALFQFNVVDMVSAQFTAWTDGICSSWSVRLYMMATHKNDCKLAQSKIAVV